MDALTLLKNDHTKVKGLFKEVEALGDRATTSRERLFKEIDRELKLHSEAEEKIFYPAFKQHAEDSEEREEVAEAYEEHAIVANLIGELEDLDPGDERYKAKLNVMIELVKHHADEEESVMFKEAREIFDKSELDQLGEKIARFKEQAKAPA
ncbi:MAG: hemerythrin domain-containing protein [Candidatus Eremiobacteraeota bacterium]|nr:hemerythrin domain-containing protein [Candidatus Eremiobacteraeota bacterium]MBV9737719.1 hemerythrin domain-containing protein [Candidatus Eremiobacteraeota bacterium]